jgi:hypothetical protein
MFSVLNGNKSVLYEGRWRNGVYKKTDYFDDGMMGKSNRNVPGNGGAKKNSRPSALMIGSEK